MSEEREEYKVIEIGETVFINGKFIQLNEVDESKWITWKITTPHSWDEVTAQRAYIDENCLIFENENGELLAAYAPGQWLEVKRVED